MARTSKKKTDDKSGSGFALFDDSETITAVDDEDLPKDEAGRQKIKQQYVDLLGIRIQKLKGRILNRERINKTLEGIYFICARCAEVCHNLDEGLVEDEDNEKNLCSSCSHAASAVKTARAAKAARDARTAKSTKKTRSSKAAAKSGKTAKSAPKTKSKKKSSKSKR